MGMAYATPKSSEGWMRSVLSVFQTMGVVVASRTLAASAI